MAGRKPRPLTGAYQLLLRVPKVALVEDLITHHSDPTPLRRALAPFRSSTFKPTRKNLVTLSVPELALAFEKSTATSEDDARRLHNAWRYRGMKSLFLYRATSATLHVAGLLDRLNSALHDAVRTIETADLNVFDDDFQFDDIDPFRATRYEVHEIRYRYSAPIEYVDPADEDAKVVADLRNGFAWYSPRGGWLAVAARDLVTRDRVAVAIQNALGVTIAGLRFNKEIVARLEPEAKRRRVALVDHTTHTTRRYTGKQLGSDQTAQREIKHRLPQDDAPFSGYALLVDKHTEMVIGYNNSRGKIFFSKDLTAHQLRTWGPDKIDTILSAVNAEVTNRPDFKRSIIEEQLRRIPIGARDGVAELAAAAAACKAGNGSEHQLQINSTALREQLGALVSPVLFALREDTEEVADLQCNSCQSDRLRLSSDGLAVECEGCGQKYGPKKIPVNNGTPIRVRELSEILQLLPSAELLDVVLHAAATITTTPVNLDEEFFYVRGDTFVYRRVSGNVVLTVDQIPELAALLDGPIPSRLRNLVHDSLPKFKEKCGKMSNANCGVCVEHRKGPKCFLRLFGLVDGSFTPQPHGSMEYGDYARRVTIDGQRDQYFVVLMKKAPRYDGAITSSKADGREILEQAFKYLQDAGTAAIGVCVPRLIHDNLKKLLVQLTRWHNKKLVFLDEQVLGRMVSSAMSRRRMKLEDF